MSNNSTNHRPLPIPRLAREFLLSERGAFVKIARRMKVHRSHVSKVFSGQRRSKRIRRALLKQAGRIAIRHGYRLGQEIQDAVREHGPGR